MTRDQSTLGAHNNRRSLKQWLLEAVEYGTDKDQDEAWTQGFNEKVFILPNLSKTQQDGLISE